MFLSRDQTEVNRVEEFTLAYTEQEHIRVLFANLFDFKKNHIIIEQEC